MLPLKAFQPLPCYIFGDVLIFIYFKILVCLDFNSKTSSKHAEVNAMLMASSGHFSGG